MIDWTPTYSLKLLRDLIHSTEGVQFDPATANPFHATADGAQGVVRLALDDETYEILIKPLYVKAKERRAQKEMPCTD